MPGGKGCNDTVGSCGLVDPGDLGGATVFSGSDGIGLSSSAWQERSGA
jgi:hypothetical protein